MTGNQRIVEAIDQGQRVIGSFVLGHDPVLVRIAQGSGLDFLLLDAEHGAFSLPLISRFIDAAKGTNLSILVRCTVHQVGDLQALLDHGLDGVIVAGARSAKDVTDIVQHLKYPPLGTRGLNPFVAAASYGATDHDTFMLEQNDKTTIWLLAENKQFLSELREVCRLPGVDGIFFGPYDLSIDLGVPGQVNHKSVLDAIADARNVIGEAGLGAGIFADSPASMEKWEPLNFDFLALGFDWSTLRMTWSNWSEMYRK